MPPTDAEQKRGEGALAGCPGCPHHDTYECPLSPTYSNGSTVKNCEYRYRNLAQRSDFLDDVDRGIPRTT